MTQANIMSLEEMAILAREEMQRLGLKRASRIEPAIEDDEPIDLSPDLPISQPAGYDEIMRLHALWKRTQDKADQFKRELAHAIRKGRDDFEKVQKELQEIASSIAAESDSAGPAEVPARSANPRSKNPRPRREAAGAAEPADLGSEPAEHHADDGGNGRLPPDLNHGADDERQLDLGFSEVGGVYVASPRQLFSLGAE